MTFEYRDPDGDRLTIAPYARNEGPVLSIRIDESLTDCVVHVPLDRVEEVIAGIRDVARTAARQTTGQNNTVRLCACGNYAAPHPFPGCAEPAPAVGQPAEAHDTEARPARDDLYDALDQSWYRWDPQSMAKGTGIIRLIDAHAAEVRAVVLSEAIKTVLGRVEAYEGMGQDAVDRNRERSAIAEQLRRMADGAES